MIKTLPINFTTILYIVWDCWLYDNFTKNRTKMDIHKVNLLLSDKKECMNKDQEKHGKVKF